MRRPRRRRLKRGNYARPVQEFERGPQGLSQPRFWPWYDSLTPEQRARINYEGRTPAETEAIATQIWRETR